MADDDFYRSFMMANKEQQRLQIQAMESAPSIGVLQAMQYAPSIGELQAMESAFIRDHFANQNSNTPMAAGRSNFCGSFNRTLRLGLRAESRMIRKTYHTSYLDAYAEYQKHFMVQAQPNQEGMIMNMGLICYKRGRVTYYPSRFGPLGFSLATPSYGRASNLIAESSSDHGVTTEELEPPEQLDLTLRLGPPGV